MGKGTGRRGKLTVVGTGISLGQVTAEVSKLIEHSEKVLYCVADAATERWIQKLNPTAESLYVFYGDDKPRSETYEQMVARILECVREQLRVCVVFYGHPGIFVYPSHESIKRARAEGFEAKMLPAISSLDCMFADLGIDPAAGCQMFEATDLLLRKRRLDTSASLIVWQVACVGDFGFNFKGYDGRNLPFLVEALQESYGADYEVVVYEASQYSICEPVIKNMRLSELTPKALTGISTLYVPPKEKAPIYKSVSDQLGLADTIEKMRKAGRVRVQAGVVAG
jgi:uncharacterized protein YabN with tetrapyrrole methylase and pyrophosphatase domain